MKSNVFNLLAVVFIVLALAGAPATYPTQAQELGPLSGSVMQGTALGTAFTYQGRLTDAGGALANGEYDFEFKLYDALSGGSQVGGSVVQNNVTITDGLFTVQLDFGNVFDGTALYLEIGVRPAGGGTYTTLTPRLTLTAAPYALYASQAPWSGLTGVPADLADGDDNTTYTAGSGLSLTGTQFDVTGAPWSGLTGVPAGFADGVDDNTTYTAGSGLSLTGAQFDVTGAPWSGLTGVPAGFADGVDDNTTYTAGDGLELVGTQFKGKGTSYQNVVIVAKSGGDFTTITAALTSILDASASNHYLVYVAPGVYTESVTMKQYVDIEGAGELVTKITQVGSAALDTGTVAGANDAELRFLTVENTGGTYATAIYNYSASPHLTHVSASASGGTENYGVYNDFSSPTMTDVSASASGGLYNYGVYNYWYSSPAMTDVSASASGGAFGNHGVYNDFSSPTMTNITVSASGGENSFGVFNAYSSPTINNSVISASGGTNNYGIFNSAPSGSYIVLVNNSQISGSTSTIHTNAWFTTRIGASQLSGGAVAGAGTVTCAGVYDEAYTFYASTCP